LSSFFSLFSYSTFRVSSKAPAQTKASPAGVASKRWWRGGADLSSVGSRVWLGPIVAYWSRSLDPSCQIWRVLQVVFFIVQFRWQELLHAGKMESGISANKTSLSSLFWRVGAALDGGYWLSTMCFQGRRRRISVPAQAARVPSISSSTSRLVSSMLYSLSWLAVAARGGE
jgi:hypothetical protein